jgi:hypothetical protein
MSLWRSLVPRRYGVGDAELASFYAVIDNLERATAVSDDGAGDRP